MVNVFYTAGGKLDIDGWTLIERAGLTYIAIPDANRQMMYTGPKIESIPSLNDHEKDVLLSLLGIT